MGIKIIIKNKRKEKTDTGKKNTDFLLKILNQNQVKNRYMKCLKGINRFNKLIACKEINFIEY